MALEGGGADSGGSWLESKNLIINHGPEVCLNVGHL